MKKLTTTKIWQFAAGQLGWAILSGIISNWLVYFYQPDAPSVAAGQQIFIPQGLVILGFLTVLGAISAFGRVFDAVTDPLIASASDRCRSPLGRRIPFLRWSAVPLCLFTILVFWSPINGNSWWNALFLFVMVLGFYFSLTAYCTPYNALIPEIGKDQEQRMKISTLISFTFILGTAIAYVAPMLWGMLESSMDRVLAIRLVFTAMALLALVCLLIPAFSIREKDYVVSAPVQEGVIKSLAATFTNREFIVFTGSDVFYWIALTMFQTGLPFFVTALLRLPESMTTLYFVGMTALSLVFYVPINLLVKKAGKKTVLLFAFAMFSLCFAYTGFLGVLPGISPFVQGMILTVAAAIPMAVFGILPTAMIADIAQCDSIEKGSSREGMYYAARTFAFKMGQSISMLIFTAIAAVGTATGEGYRLAAWTAAALCLIGGIILLFYNEKKISRTITSKEN